MSDSDEVSRIDYDRRSAKDDLHPDQVEQALHKLDEFDKNLRFWALVTAINPENTDSYVVDIYPGDGNGNFGGNKTHTNIIAHPTDPNQKFDVGNRLRVRFIDAATTLIQPIEIPQVTGFGKMWMIIDDANPGTQAWENPRFINDA